MASVTAELTGAPAATATGGARLRPVPRGTGGGVRRGDGVGGAADPVRGRLRGRPVPAAGPGQPGLAGHLPLVPPAGRHPGGADPGEVRDRLRAQPGRRRPGRLGGAPPAAGFSAVLGGAALLILSAFAPWALFRLLPFVEAGAVGHLEDLSQRARQHVAAPTKGLAQVAMRAASVGSAVGATAGIAGGSLLGSATGSSGLRSLSAGGGRGPGSGGGGVDSGPVPGSPPDMGPSSAESTGVGTTEPPGHGIPMHAGASRSHGRGPTDDGRAGRGRSVRQPGRSGLGLGSGLGRSGPGAGRSRREPAPQAASPSDRDRARRRSRARRTGGQADRGPPTSRPSDPARGIPGRRLLGGGIGPHWWVTRTDRPGSATGSHPWSGGGSSPDGAEARSPRWPAGWSSGFWLCVPDRRREACSWPWSSSRPAWPWRSGRSTAAPVSSGSRS